MGFIEAGASDFLCHVAMFMSLQLPGHQRLGRHLWLFDSQERQDMYDLVEWAAEQSWSDGNVGMIGISYFAMTQMGAAVKRPPHLKAIMPLAGTFDLYDYATHHGLVSSSFVTPFYL